MSGAVAAQVLSTATRKLPELEGLRGLLALWVTSTHILCWCGVADISVPERLRGGWATFIYAQPSVDVFVILSGFAIFHLLHEKPATYGGYMMGRLFRIVPVYWTCLFLGVAVIWIEPHLLARASWRGSLYLRWMHEISDQQLSRFWPHFSAHAFLLHGLVPRPLLPEATGALLVPAWSISLEWQFYLVAPALSAVWDKRWIVLLILALGISSPWWAHDFINGHDAFLPLKLPLFLLGAACYTLERWLRSRPSAAEKFGPPIVLVVIAAAWIFRWERWAVIGWTLAYSVAVGVWSHRFSWLEKVGRAVLLHPAVQWLGRRSYSLYLLHWPLVVGALSLLVYSKPEVSSYAAAAFMMLVGLPLILAGSALLHRVIEAPGMRTGRRLSSELTKAPGLPAN